MNFRWTRALWVAVGLSLIGTSAGAQLKPLRVTSNIAHTEILLQGGAHDRSGPAPLVVDDLAPGRYQLRLFLQGREHPGARVILENQVQLRDSRTQRTILSSLVPGLGQLRDFGKAHAIVPFSSVTTSVVRALQFQADRGEAQDELDSWLSVGYESRTRTELVDHDFNPVTPPELREVPMTEADYDQVTEDLMDRRWLAEQTRNDYLRLGAAFHAGNILSANVRRGAFQVELAGAHSLAVRYQPPSRMTVVGLSALWPGLGQARVGKSGRSAMWNLATMTVGMFLMESLRDLDEGQVDIWRHDRQLARETEEEGAPSGATLALRSEAGRDRERAETASAGLLMALGAIWALNVADAVLVSDHTPTTAFQQASRRPAVNLGWVAGAPGLQVGWRF